MDLQDALLCNVGVKESQKQSMWNYPDSRKKKEKTGIFIFFQALLINWGQIRLEASSKYCLCEWLRKHNACLLLFYDQKWPPSHVFIPITCVCSTCNVAFTSSKTSNKRIQWQTAAYEISRNVPCSKLRQQLIPVKRSKEKTKNPACHLKVKLRE